MRATRSCLHTHCISCGQIHMHGIMHAQWSVHMHQKKDGEISKRILQQINATRLLLHSLVAFVTIDQFHETESMRAQQLVNLVCTSVKLLVDPCVLYCLLSQTQRIAQCGPIACFQWYSTIYISELFPQSRANLAPADPYRYTPPATSTPTQHEF